MRTTGFIACLLMAAIVVVGCARKHTYYAPGGKVTVDEKGGKAKTMTVDTGKGKATIEMDKKSITEAELGAPVYPGAKVEVSGNYEGAKDESGLATHTILTTPDSFDKVFEFYKGHLEKIDNSMNQSTGDGNLGILTAKHKGMDVTIHIITDKEKNVTRIQVMKMQKPG